MHVRTCTRRFCISETVWPIVFKFGMWVGVVHAFHKSWVGWGISARAHVQPPPLSPYLRIRLNNFAHIWCVVRDPIVTRFTKVGGGVTAHSHVRLQFRCLGNRSTLTLKPHQKQTYLFRSRSFIAKHGVLLVSKLTVHLNMIHFKFLIFYVKYEVYTKYCVIMLKIIFISILKIYLYAFLLSWICFWGELGCEVSTKNQYLMPALPRPFILPPPPRMKIPSLAVPAPRRHPETSSAAQQVNKTAINEMCSGRPHSRQRLLPHR